MSSQSSSSPERPTRKCETSLPFGVRNADSRHAPTARSSTSAVIGLLQEPDRLGAGQAQEPASGAIDDHTVGARDLVEARDLVHGTNVA